MSDNLPDPIVRATILKRTIEPLVDAMTFIGREMRAFRRQYTTLPMPERPTCVNETENAGSSITPCIDVDNLEDEHDNTQMPSPPSGKDEIHPANSRSTLLTERPRRVNLKTETVPSIRFKKECEEVKTEPTTESVKTEPVLLPMPNSPKATMNRRGMGPVHFVVIDGDDKDKENGTTANHTNVLKETRHYPKDQRRRRCGGGKHMNGNGARCEKKRGSRSSKGQGVSMRTRQQVREIIAKRDDIGNASREGKNNLKNRNECGAGSSRDANASLWNGFNEDRSSYDLVRNRSKPEVRTNGDILRELETGVHTGCASCRKHALNKLEGKDAKAFMYEGIVSKCTHVPLGKAEEQPQTVGDAGLGYLLGEDSYQSGDYRM